MDTAVLISEEQVDGYVRLAKAAFMDGINQCVKDLYMHRRAINEYRAGQRLEVPSATFDMTWVFSGDKLPRSFEWYCDIFDINAERARDAIVAYSYKAESESMERSVKLREYHASGKRPETRASIESRRRIKELLGHLDTDFRAEDVKQFCGKKSVAGELKLALQYGWIERDAHGLYTKVDEK
jgi:hypothetical protein